MSGAIAAVEPGSPAARAGLAAGDVLVAIDGHPLRDVIDYRFWGADTTMTVAVRRHSNGRSGALILPTEGSLRRRPDEDWGIAFGEAVFDGVARCRNRCPFCFLRGLPSGLRRDVYFKDDDYRLSFLFGNFTTLSHLSEADWARLRQQRLSPLYVSVHATDIGLRRRLLGNATPPDVVAQLRRLGALGIVAHCQIVVCPGVNDGAALAQTVADLAALYPTVQSVGLAPLGASRQFIARASFTVVKDGVEMRLVDEAVARDIVRATRGWQRGFRRRYGVGFVYAADEFYLLAGARLPSGRAYDGYPQLENGIGMARRFGDDWRRARRRLTVSASGGWRGERRRWLAVTGALFAPLLATTLAELAALGGPEVRALPVVNRLFGETVTVAGLLGGGDVLAALKAAPDADGVLLPRAALDGEGRRFIDNITLVEVERELALPVVVVDGVDDMLRAVAARQVESSTADVGIVAGEGGRKCAA